MIIVKPLAGLANRMRVIDSAMSLSEQFRMPLKIAWNKERSLNCHYEELFLPVDEFTVSHSWYDSARTRIRPWESVSFILRERLRLNVTIAGKTWIYDRHPSSLQDFDFSRLKDRKSVFISTAHRFGTPAHIRKLKPVPHLAERIERACTGFSDKTIGIHIRRTDSRLSIEKSPDHLFFDNIRELIQKDDEVDFFLATDDAGLKARLQEAFPGKIISNRHKLGRDDCGGIQNALVDMYCLSRTAKIYGSFYSSFSATAAMITGIPIEILAAGSG